MKVRMYIYIYIEIENITDRYNYNFPWIYCLKMDGLKKLVTIFNSDIHAIIRRSIVHIKIHEIRKIELIVSIVSVF